MRSSLLTFPLENVVKGRGDGWEVANIALKHERMSIGDANKMASRLHRLVALLSAQKVGGKALIQSPEFLTRLLTLQGEVLAWTAHSRRLLAQYARGEDPGVNRLIIKYGGSTLAHRLSSLAVDALGSEGTVFLSEGEDAQDDEVANWNMDYLYDVGVLIGGGTWNLQRNIIAERGLGLPREPPTPSAKLMRRRGEQWRWH